MAFGTTKNLTQFRVRGSFPDGVSQACFFLFADSEAQAVRAAQKVAPKVNVVAVEPIGKLVPVDDAAPRSAKISDTAPAMSRFFTTSRPSGGCQE
jgi:hypothetical protein